MILLELLLLNLVLAQRIVESNLQEVDGRSRSKRQYDYVPPKMNPDISEENTCGLQQIRPTVFDRIVGGSMSKPHSWPWQVSLQILISAPSTREDLKQWQHYCGGTLISKDCVATAAHCVEGRADNAFRVLVGCHNIYNPADSSNNGVCKAYAVRSIVRHPQYSGRSTGYVNDIAIVCIDRPVNISREVSLICLPKFWTPNSDDLCVATGWGLTETGSYSETLKQVKLSYVDRDICERIYSGTKVPNNTICAGGSPEGGQDTCQGDSGGPWQCFIEGRFWLCGLTSVGVDCARPNRPGIYTPIHYHYQWIDSYINDRDECKANGGRGPCEQICINTYGSYRCACKEGYTLVDAYRCKSPNTSCGTSVAPEAIDTSVIEPTTVQPGQYPWLVGIAKRLPHYDLSVHPDAPRRLYDHLCSGSMVYRGWILTHSDCLFDKTTKEFIRKEEIVVRYFRPGSKNQQSAANVIDARLKAVFPSNFCDERISKYLKGEVSGGEGSYAGESNCLILLRIDERALPVDLPPICLPTSLNYEQFEDSVCVASCAYTDDTSGALTVRQQYKELHGGGYCPQQSSSPSDEYSDQLFIQSYPERTWDRHTYTLQEKYREGLPCLRDAGAQVYCHLYDKLWLAGVVKSQECKTKVGCQSVVKTSDFQDWITKIIQGNKTP